MDPAEMFRDRLIARLQEIRDMASGDRARSEPVSLDQSKVGRLSRMDAMQGQAMSAAVRKRREQELRRIESALERIESGEFGYCVRCGEEIAMKRLEIDPAAAQCATCAGGNASIN